MKRKKMVQCCYQGKGEMVVAVESYWTICSYINTLPTYRWIGWMWTQRDHARLTRRHPHWHTRTATLLTVHQLIISKQGYVHEARIWRVKNSAIFTPSSTVGKGKKHRSAKKTSEKESGRENDKRKGKFNTWITMNNGISMCTFIFNTFGFRQSETKGPTVPLGKKKKKQTNWMEYTNRLNRRKTTQIMINISAIPASIPIMAGSTYLSGSRDSRVTMCMFSIVKGNGFSIFLHKFFSPQPEHCWLCSCRRPPLTH